MEAEKSLADLRKKSQANMVSSSNNDKKKDEEVNVNIDEILSDLKKDILKIYKNTSTSKESSHSDFHTK